MKNNNSSENHSIPYEVESTSSLGRQMLNKVPQITVFFWIIKVLTTGMGEVASDYLANHISPVIAVALTGIVLVASLVLQFSVRRYVAWIYWLNVIMVSIFGTMAADVVHVGFGIPYIVSTTFFMLVLAIIFVIWYASEKTLSIHSIYTRKREVFYWATVLGYIRTWHCCRRHDCNNNAFRLFLLWCDVCHLDCYPSYSLLVFGLNEIFAFWFAYIVTRPLGASFADWMGVSHARGGLGLGTGSVSLA